MCGSGVIRLVLFFEAVHWGQTRQCIDAVDFHRAGAAHAFAAGPPERQSRVDLVVDLDQRIEDHRPAVIAVDVEGVHRRVGVFRGPSNRPESSLTRSAGCGSAQCLPSPTFEFAGSVNSDIEASPCWVVTGRRGRPALDKNRN
jgi:hypothetical protein